MALKQGCPTYNPSDIWLDQDRQQPDWGCDVGCQPCLFQGGVGANMLDGVGAPDDGRRWLKPHEEYSSRDAWGNYHDLRSNRAHLHPQGVNNWSRAQVWFNNGRECYNRTICDADPQIDADWTGSTDCRDGTTANQLRTGPRADINFYVGSGYGSAENWIHCRKESPPELEPLDTVGRGEPLTNMLSLRALGCVSNMLIPCLGEFHGNNCNEPVTGYHNDSANRGAWNLWHVWTLAPSLLYDETLHHITPEVAAVFAVKNAALDYIGQHKGEMHLDQLEKSDGAGVSNFLHPNLDIGTWWRSFSSEFIALAPRYLHLPNSRLRFSGNPVNVWLAITGASIEMHLILHTVNHRTSPSGYHHRLYPSPRFRIHADLGAYAESDDVVIINSPDRLPRVEGGVDVIDFIDDEGRLFVPPAVVEWEGARQELSSGPGVWEDLFGGGGGQSGGPGGEPIEPSEIAPPFGRRLRPADVLPTDVPDVAPPFVRPIRPGGSATEIGLPEIAPPASGPIRRVGGAIGIEPPGIAPPFQGPIRPGGSGVPIDVPEVAPPFEQPETVAPGPGGIQIVPPTEAEQPFVVLRGGEPGGATHVYCIELARMLNDLHIPGAPTMQTDVDMIRHFGGEVVVGLNA